MSYLTWINVGGQLIPDQSIQRLIQDIKSGTIDSWEAVHEFYKTEGDQYFIHKVWQAIAAYEMVFEESLTDNHETILEILEESIHIKKWLTGAIRKSREKDYHDPFRSMVYVSREERNTIVGPLEKNEFILASELEFQKYTTEVKHILEQWPDEVEAERRKLNAER